MNYAIMGAGGRIAAIETIRSVDKVGKVIWSVMIHTDSIPAD
jgi:hypothetical protein